MISKMLILEDVGVEAILDTLRSASVEFHRRLLKSQPSNWERIIQLIDSENIDAIIATFSETTALECSGAKYDNVFNQLTQRLLETQHAVFVFEDNLDGVFTWFSATPKSFDQMRVNDEDISRMRDRFRSMQDSGVNVVPYRKRAEKNLSAQAFVDELVKGIVLRIYVPNNRIYAEQLERFISLLTTYAQRVVGSDLALEQARTSQGIIYTFHSPKGETSMGQLAAINEEFTSFLDVCATDIARAEVLLKGKGVSSSEVPTILRRYAVEARRLRLDISHEHEAKLLAIRHRLESEMLDIASPPEIESIIATVARSTALSSAPGIALPSISGNVVNLINPKFIGTVHGVVAEELSGTVVQSENDVAIREMIKENTSGIELTELLSALEILKDTSADSETRTSSWQKVRQFLARRANKMEDAAYKVLQDYIGFLFHGGVAG